MYEVRFHLTRDGSKVGQETLDSPSEDRREVAIAINEFFEGFVTPTSNLFAVEVREKDSDSDWEIYSVDEFYRDLNALNPEIFDDAAQEMPTEIDFG